MSTLDMDPLAHWVEGEKRTTVTRNDIADALGISRHTYRNRRVSGTIGPTEVLKVADSFGLSRLAALMHFGWISTEEVAAWKEHSGDNPAPPPPPINYTL